MAGRMLISSGGPFEAKAGYSRAVRVGDFVFVSGTASIKDGQVHGAGDPRAQTRRILEVIVDALEKAGSSARDVVRYRIYLTRVEDWPVVIEEVAAVFGQAMPTGTLVEVKGLILPELTVEIEVDAMIGSARQDT